MKRTLDDIYMLYFSSQVMLMLRSKEEVERTLRYGYSNRAVIVSRWCLVFLFAFALHL